MFSLPISARACLTFGSLSLAGCSSGVYKPDPSQAPQAFYTVTAEIALSRHEARVAALEYAAAAATDSDVGLLHRAADVTAECLQPSLTADVAARWIAVDPSALDAHRAAARAALDLYQIPQSAAQYRVVLKTSPRGTEAEFALLETELATAANVYGARQLADRLAAYFPASPAALRLQAFAALRADDPAAAARAFEAALNAPGAAGETPGKPAHAAPGEAAAGASATVPPGEAAAVTSAAAPSGQAAAVTSAAAPSGEAAAVTSAAAPSGEAAAVTSAAAPSGEAAAANSAAAPSGEAAAVTSAAAPSGEAAAANSAAAPSDEANSAAAARRELTQGLWRAQVMAGDADAPLATAKELLERDPTTLHRLDYTLLLLAAQQNLAARAELILLTRDAEARPVALRLLGLVDFQDGKLEDAAVRFAELATTGKYVDDALYYLGMIAERHEDLERALRLYAQVQSGDNAVAAVLRAAAILRAHGAAPAAEELLDQLLAEEPQRAPEILVARARIYSEGGDAPLAIALLDKGLREYPDSVELHYARASLSEEHGSLASALRELKTVAALRPADPAALNAYGYTLADNHRQLNRARRLIERAHAAAPGSAAILDSLGWVLFRQGHGEQALPYLNAAYEDDHDADVAAHLGEVLWQLGRRADAERIWSEANRAGADNHLVNATRLRLGAAH